MSSHGWFVLNNFSAVMNMLPLVTAKGYTEHCAINQRESEALASTSQRRASAYLHHKHSIHQS